jgi:hypothetical protein
MADETALSGGNVTDAVRVGDTVRRGTGPWTPAGREILDFLPGDVPQYPLPAAVRTDAALTAVARLLRRFHDATATFGSPAGSSWYFPAREPAEVICHGDVAPYNCVFDGAQPVGLIDFDTAHPGPQTWDVAGAAYPCTDGATLVSTVVKYLAALRDLIRSRAVTGDPAFAAMLADGHDLAYDADLRHVTRHQARFVAAVAR